MEKIKEDTQTIIEKTYRKYIKKQRQRPPTREILHLNEELAAQLPIEDRMFILNLVGRKTKSTPFDKTYYCNHCNNKFHDRNDSPRDYKTYLAEVICPHCYRCNFSETKPKPHRQERRQTTTDYTMNDFIRQMLQQK